jgi:hypothetical protein
MNDSFLAELSRRWKPQRSRCQLFLFLLSTFNFELSTEYPGLVGTVNFLS